MEFSGSVDLDHGIASGCRAGEAYRLMFAIYHQVGDLRHGREIFDDGFLASTALEIVDFDLHGYVHFDALWRLSQSAAVSLRHGESMACSNDSPYDQSHMKSMILPPSLKSLLPPTFHARCEGVRFPKSERIFQTGDKPEWMFYVVSGEVTLERTGLQGEPVVLQRTRQGFVSEASLKSAKYHCDALAIVDTTVVKIPIRDLSAELECDPNFASRWIGMLNSEVRRLRLHCERLSMKSVKDRVLHLINTEGQNGTYATRTGLKSLAGELGVTHEALYRTLAVLEKSKIICREDGVLLLVQRQ